MPVGPFPWDALSRTTRHVERRLRAARRGLEQAAVVAELGERLGALANTNVEIVVRRIDERAPPGPLWRLGFVRATSGERVGVGVEAALASALLSRLLRRPIPVVPADLPPDPGLLGALSALFVEAARATGAVEALCPGPVREVADSVLVHLTVVIEKKPYLAAVWLGNAFDTADPMPRLRELDSLAIELPLVIGAALSSARDLAGLAVGDAFCPGPGLWVNHTGVGRAVLAAGASERGISAELLPSGQIVVREPTAIALAAPESLVKTDTETANELEQTVLDAPIVVRVELASVSLTAREWASLKPGDVIETERRVGGPVVLRSGGRALAHGELVNVDGELGVRVTRLMPEEAP
jgi:flagellar motor switch/type III secretory pathway protein FliN